MDGTLTLPIHDFAGIRRKLSIGPDQPILEAIGKMPDDEHSRALTVLHEIEMDLAAQARPQPGIKQVLDRLLKADKKLAILTRNSEEIAHATLRAAGLDGYFEDRFLVGRERCVPKPLPDGVQLLLKMWSADNSKALMIGDYLYDIEAGFRAGVHTIHFDSSGVFAWPRFTDYTVTRIIDLAAAI